MLVWLNIEHFDELVHQILAHDPSFSGALVTNRFIDGLKDHIKSVVMIHKPIDLDTVSSLALLQEELTVDVSRREVRRPESSYTYKSVNRQFATPTSVVTKSHSFSSPEGKKHVEALKLQSPEEILSAIKNYRRTKGLCYKCGVRWSHNHKCAPTVSLHVVEELWQLLQEPDTIPVLSSEAESNSGDDLMTISLHAVKGKDAPKTIRFFGNLMGQKSLILLDSGSSSSFVSEMMAAQLSGCVSLAKPAQVRVASGATMLCTHELQQCALYIQDHCFNVDLKILPLQCYDIILGMDWLEVHSPMEVHWSAKWMSFMHQGQRIQLQGLKPELAKAVPISLHQLQRLELEDDIWCMLELFEVKNDETSKQWPKDIQLLLTEFSDLFEKPTGLPPKRSHSHTIPLITGAQPFRLRPYRYNPAQKDEIEKQVAELLRNGMIQESSSPFASPVLLVKKKTGEWRLCVDYRRLNAMTIKNRYPMPIMDEFLDELAGAVWFTTLDLRSGYHQILVELCDQYKTAFQTHNDHYEYKVMPYGVTGGPATFQYVMNSVLAPLLRKCVVVFIDDILIYSKTWSEHLQHIREVLELLRHHQLKVKLSKCAFAQKQIQYLGHVISKGVATDTSKVQDIQNWPTPSCVKGVRGFLGIAGYYRKFVKNFGIISKPLTNLLKKGSVFMWTKDHEKRFRL